MQNRYLALMVALGTAVAASGQAFPSGAHASIEASKAASVPAMHPHSRAAAADPSLPRARELAQAAPSINPRVLRLALSAVSCAQGEGVGTGATHLAVIDYSLSSLKPRLWVFDLPTGKLLYHDVVAHGQGSGGDTPTRFSNADGTHASSLGLFVTRNTYIGHNGLSLRMQGLEPGVNDAALARAIVMHGATYVNPAVDKGMGRLGRSWGCPALRKAVAKPIIEVMKNGQFVFSYYPDQAWLAHSALLKCPAARQRLAANDIRAGGKA